MTTHTAGPWVVHPHHAYVVPAEHANRPIGAHVDDAKDLAIYAQEIVAMHMPDRHRSEAETRANARLIAESPSMLALLQEADRLYSTYGLTATGGLEVGAWINNVRDCIAKATGVSP